MFYHSSIKVLYLLIALLAISVELSQFFVAGHPLSKFDSLESQQDENELKIISKRNALEDMIFFKLANTINSYLRLLRDNQLNPLQKNIIRNQLSSSAKEISTYFPKDPQYWTVFSNILDRDFISNSFDYGKDNGKNSVPFRWGK
jgi:hypothetical protein